MGCINVSFLCAFTVNTLIFLCLEDKPDKKPFTLSIYCTRDQCKYFHLLVDLHPNFQQKVCSKNKNKVHSQCTLLSSPIGHNSLLKSNLPLLGFISNNTIFIRRVVYNTRIREGCLTK